MANLTLRRARSARLECARFTAHGWATWFAIIAFVGLAGACADQYAPYSFKDFPGYQPPGPKEPADPHRTPKGYLP
jgi:hypothetical protein